MFRRAVVIADWGVAAPHRRADEWGVPQTTDQGAPPAQSPQSATPAPAPTEWGRHQAPCFSFLTLTHPSRVDNSLLVVSHTTRRYSKTVHV